VDLTAGLVLLRLTGITLNDLRQEITIFQAMFGKRNEPAP
jgi:hypothetical protein